MTKILKPEDWHDAFLYPTQQYCGIFEGCRKKLNDIFGFEVIHLSYSQWQKKDKFILMSNSEQYTYSFLSKKAYKDSPFFKYHDTEDEGHAFFVPRREINIPCYNDFLIMLQEKWNIDLNFCFFNKHEQTCDLFYLDFLMGKNNDCVELMNKIIRYFSVIKMSLDHFRKNEVAPLIRDEKLFSKKIWGLKQSPALNKPTSKRAIEKLKKQLYEFDLIHENDFDFIFVDLEEPFKTCVELSLDGRSARDVAKEVFQSASWVRSKVDEAKKKMNCDTKPELIDRYKRLLKVREFLHKKDLNEV